MEWNPDRVPGFAYKFFSFRRHDFQGSDHHVGAKSIDPVLGVVGKVVCHFLW